MPGLPLHLVMDSELVLVGLTGKCEKWSQHKWVGLRRPLAHTDLWKQLCGQWLLLGDSVSVQWVPFHVGVQGNEHADLTAGRGLKAAKHAVIAQKSITDIWLTWLTWGCRKCVTAMTRTQMCQEGGACLTVIVIVIVIVKCCQRGQAVKGKKCQALILNPSAHETFDSCQCW